MKRTLVALLLVVACPALAGDFVTNPSSTLPGPKTPARALPAGSDPNKFISSADFNALRNAAFDLRAALASVPISSTGVSLVDVTAPKLKMPDASGAGIYFGTYQFFHGYHPSGVPGLNLFAGTASGNLTLTSPAIANSCYGASTCLLLTTGYDNTAVGVYALASMTTGYQNTTIGEDSMANATTSHNSATLGVGALYWLTTGNDNTATGEASGYSVTTGSENTISGIGAGYGLQTGGKNVLVGGYAAQGNGQTTGTHSNGVVLGYSAGYGLTTGSNNILLGYGAGQSLTTGHDNTLIGYQVDSAAADTSGYINIENVIEGPKAGAKTLNLSADKTCHIVYSGWGATTTCAAQVVGDLYVTGMVKASPNALGTCGAGGITEGTETPVAGTGSTPTKKCLCTYTPTGAVWAWVNLAKNSAGTGIGNATTCP